MTIRPDLELNKSDSPDLSGQKLGGYELAALLGRSGSVEEYRAHQARGPQDVAVTVLHGCPVDDDAFVERFRREASMAATLRHGNVARVSAYDVAIANGEALPYLVTDLAGGITLRDRIAQLSAAGQFMPWPEVLSIVTGIGSALDYAHGQGVVHRDVKPANILLSTQGGPALTGFGIAAIVGSTLHTLGDGPTGTPAYTSPELGRGDPVDGRADLYSLGVVLFELCTIQLPFVADSASGMIVRHLTEPPLSPCKANPALSPAVEQVVLRALSKSPEDRFQSAAEMTRALQEALSGAPAAQGADVVAGNGLVAQLPASGAPIAGRVRTDEEPTGDATAALRRAEDAVKDSGLRNFFVGLMAVVTTSLALLEKFFKAIDLLRNPLIGLAVVVLGLGTVAISAGYVLARPRLYGKLHRRLAIAGLAVTVTAALVWGGWTLADLIRPPKGLVVLIADFEQAPGSRTVDYPRRIEAGLNESLQKLKVDGIFVERANEVYAEKDARARAAAKKAAVVIYGWYDDAGVNPRFELVKAPRQYLPIVKQSAVELASLDRLEIRVDRELREMNYIAAATIGMSYYADGQNRPALTFFDLALRSALTDTRLMGRESVGFYKASTLVFLNDYQQAIPALQEAVRLKPDFAEAHRNLAIVYNATCDPAGAEREAAEAVRLKPDSAASHQLVGLILGRQGRWTEAAQAYSQALKFAPDDPSLHGALGEALVSEGRAEEGRAELLRAAAITSERLRASPDDPQTMAANADALYAQGKLDEAAAQYERAIGRGEVQGMQPNRLAWLQRSLGLTRWGQQRWPDMMVAYARAISLSPGLDTDAVAMGIASQATGKSDEAMSWFRKALSLMPCDANTRSLLGALLEKQGRHEEALAEYTQAAKQDPNDPVVWQSIGVILDAQGHQTEARTAFGKAVSAARERLKLNPRDANLAFLLGAAYSELEDYVQAVAAFRKAVTLAPDVAGHYALGNAYYQTRQYDQALAEYQAALALDAKHLGSLVGTGDSLDRLNRRVDAIAAYRQALALSDDASVRYSLGSILEGQGEYEQAAAEYQASLRLKDDALVRMSLAGLYERTGDIDLAATEYLASLRLQDQPEAHFALARILERERRLEDAAGHYREAAAQFPADGTYRDSSRVAHSSVLARLCRMDEALTVLQPSLAPGPSRPVEVLAQLAYVYEAQGRLLEAGKVYSALLQTSSSLPGVHYLAGGFAYRQSRMTDAVEEMTEAVRLAPAFSMAWSALGGLHAAQGDRTAASAAYEAALKAMPANVNAIVGLGTLALEEDDPAAALLRFQTALQGLPGYLKAIPDETNSVLFSIHLFQGFAQERLGRPEAAKSQFALAMDVATKAKAAVPGQPQASFQMGIALWVSGDDVKAASAFAEAARCDASLGAEQGRAVQRLRRLWGK
jgi:tetratricopeptide (TPR) repeat protein